VLTTHYGRCHFIRELARDLVQPADSIQRAGWDVELRNEIVQVPTQTVLNAGPFADEVLVDDRAAA